MANLKDVIYLSNADYNTLATTGTVTIGSDTLTYSTDNVYITPDVLASSTEDGLMSASDKIKLDGINLSNYLPLTGGTLSGNLILNNSIAIQSKNSSGTALNILYTNSSNNIILGNTSLSGIYTYNGIYPGATNSYNLGTSSSQWKNLYLSGTLRNDNANYGLALPSMSSWTANRTIATTGENTFSADQSISTGTLYLGGVMADRLYPIKLYCGGSNTQNRVLTLPDASGTLALTSNIVPSTTTWDPTDDTNAPTIKAVTEYVNSRITTALNTAV